MKSFPHALRFPAVVLILLLSGLSALAQYTDPVVIADLGGAEEFARRRQELAKQLKTGYWILFARTGLPEANHYREDNDFFYYTGLSDPGAVLVVDVVRGTSVIFEPQQSARVQQVYGSNLLSMTAEQQEKLGYKTVLPISVLDTQLAFLLARETDLWLRLTFPVRADGARVEVGREYADQYENPYGDPTPGDRAALKKLAERSGSPSPRCHFVHRRDAKHQNPTRDCCVAPQRPPERRGSPASHRARPAAGVRVPDRSAGGLCVPRQRRPGLGLPGDCQFCRKHQHLALFQRPAADSSE